MKASVTFFAYPNFEVESEQYSVSISQLFQNSLYPCILMPSPGVTAWCNNMVNTLATSSFGYNMIQYFVPGKIPNRDGTLTRLQNYSVIFQSNQVKDTLQATFDCYSGQSLTIYGSTLLLANRMNPAMVSCKNDMHTFVGAAYDEMITRVIFQQYEDFRAGQVYTVDFRSESQTLNSSSEWLDCKYSLDEEYCLVVLGKGQELQHYYLNVQQLIYKDDKIVKIFPLSPTLSLSCVQSASAQIMDSQACVSLASICDSTSKSTADALLRRLRSLLIQPFKFISVSLVSQLFQYLLFQLRIFKKPTFIYKRFKWNFECWSVQSSNWICLRCEHCKKCKEYPVVSCWNSRFRCYYYRNRYQKAVGVKFYNKNKVMQFSMQIRQQIVSHCDTQLKYCKLKYTSTLIYCLKLFLNLKYSFYLQKHAKSLYQYQRLLIFDSDNMRFNVNVKVS
ncbi:Hypothetical_protein [Hexamita inflata]|uniref:Hypothetical_protein n=1 Tax=Hexamita inflata TaxID=28002 RepID=A0AA86QUX8_9EUKA|nr:Hypothetical protein HINF_LOCUS54169 [Hexamita inflata]